MMPAEPENESLKNWRIQSWKNRIAPEGYAFPGDPRNWEQERYSRAKLNALGEKLLGLTRLVDGFTTQRQKNIDYRCDPRIRVWCGTPLC